MMNVKDQYFILIGLLFIWTLLFCSCSAVNQVRTVGKGNTGLELTLGGPMMTNLGGPIPIPNLFIGARYGLFQDLDIAALYNLTGPIIPGIGFDLITKLHWVPVQPGIRTQTDTPMKGWGFGSSLILQWVTDFQHGFVIFPAVEIAGGWRNKWFNPFIGMSLGFNFYRPDGKKPMSQINPFFGTEFIIRDRASIGLKCTFYETAYNFYGSQVDWVYIVNKPEEKKMYGALGIALGYSYNFGRSKRKAKTR